MADFFAWLTGRRYQRFVAYGGCEYMWWAIECWGWD